MQKLVYWLRSEEGYTQSKEGRFLIEPKFMGSTIPLAYKITDYVSGNTKSVDTQKEGKMWAEEIRQREVERL